MKTIGKYRIQGLLGRGGMGRVYKVQIPVIGKIAALKQLDPHPFLADLLGMERIRRLFVSEAVTMARLRHRNIVDVNDFGEEKGRPYYLMAYYVHNLGDWIGETFEAESSSRIIRVDRCIDYGLQVLDGLESLHHQGIVHRDIKPHNLLITDDGTVKICDFGLSKLRGERFAGPAGLKVGTPWYAPPEQEADPDGVGATADLYAVGVTLYRMLTGRLPDTPPAPASLRNPDLDENWDAFLLRATAADPADRFASARAMGRRLTQLAADWRRRMEGTCRTSPNPPPVQPSATLQTTLRNRPIKVAGREARNCFGLDALWRPKTTTANRFETDGRTVRDAATGLLWQQLGTAFPLSWQRAHEYIEQCNREAHEGRDDWRLPTTAELASLLAPAPHETDFCIESVFSRRQRWLWSCDRKSFTAAWYVNVELGFVFWQDFSAALDVRAVCSA